jgi:pimeloyl-ACP methyl ester carboxylesterase
MPNFISHDGTELAYHLRGEGDGDPLVCLPGGAMRASAYLGDLGGLAERRPLVLLDLRGTGDSALPADEATYRVDHQVADVEALRAHLGLERMDLLAHSAGGDLALLYAAAHPDRVGRLVLVTTPARSVGLPPVLEHRLAAARLRAGEPWYEEAFPVFEKLFTGELDDPASWSLVLPFFYGRWDETAQAHAALDDSQTNARAQELYSSAGAFDPPATRAALKAVTARVLVLAGELDGNPCPARAMELAALFPHGTWDVQPDAGHFPWLDDPRWFTDRIGRFIP